MSEILQRIAKCVKNYFKLFCNRLLYMIRSPHEHEKDNGIPLYL